jgi:hypothetical protein
MGANTRDYAAQKEPEILDADMTPRDLIETLKRLRFQDGSCAIFDRQTDSRLSGDRGVRLAPEETPCSHFLTASLPLS